VTGRIVTVVTVERRRMELVTVVQRIEMPLRSRRGSLFLQI